MYLQELTEQLASGLARLPDDFRGRHSAYLLAARNDDGGFSGREGGSDLYYTAFALRGLAVLDALTPDIAAQSADYLRGCLVQEANVVDFFSLLYACLLIQAYGGPDVLADSPADWPDRVARTLESFRTADGGYAKTIGGASGSTYHTFLVGLCYQLLGRELPRQAEVISFIHSRRRDDGGFVEIAPMKRSGTNPTAAAVGVLQLCGGALDGELRAGVIAFLADMPSAEGGFRANARAPLADLLSTFTGIWTLRQLDALDHIDHAAARRYAEALDEAIGGFRGGLWDERTDVEYTFYGLGVVGVLG
ncbi:MAG: prenyltransferase/squalene oxidase repeat-containing protein [Gemmataceae bacterium]